MIESNIDLTLHESCVVKLPDPSPATGFKQSGKLSAVQKGEDTPSEDEDEPPKQDTGEQKKFPRKSKRSMCYT